MNQTGERVAAKDKILKELARARKNLETAIEISKREIDNMDLLDATLLARGNLTKANKLILAYHLKFCLTQTGKFSDPEKFTEEVVRAYRYRD